MSKFEVGQRVRLIDDVSQCGVIEKFAGMNGSERAIVKVPWIRWDEDGYLLWEEENKIEDATPEDTSKFHKHHDLIIAWAKGAKVEYRPKWSNDWVGVSDPFWDGEGEYRIKPKPEVTYKVGQKFILDGAAEYILSACAADSKTRKVILINTTSGYRWADQVDVNSFTEITKKEFEKMVGSKYVNRFKLKE